MNLNVSKMEVERLKEQALKLMREMEESEKSDKFEMSIRSSENATTESNGIHDHSNIRKNCSYSLPLLELNTVLVKWNGDMFVDESKLKSILSKHGDISNIDFRVDNSGAFVTFSSIDSVVSCTVSSVVKIYHLR
jgi:hypothetical protein